MKKRKNGRKFSHKPLKRVEIEAIEREYWDKYNSGMPKWQADMYN